MKKALVLSTAVLLVLNACGPSQHRAPLTARNQRTGKTVDSLTKQSENLLASMYGSKNGSTAGIKVLQSSASAQKLQSEIFGASLKLEEVADESGKGRYFLATISTARKKNKMCEVKDNQQQVYSLTDLTAKGGLSNSVANNASSLSMNIRCIDAQCAHVILLIEERSQVQAGPRMENDYGVMAVVLKKGAGNVYDPIQMNSSLFKNLESAELGARRCAEKVLNEIGAATPSIDQSNITDLIKRNSNREIMNPNVESMRNSAAQPSDAIGDAF